MGAVQRLDGSGSLGLNSVLETPRGLRYSLLLEVTRGFQKPEVENLGSISLYLYLVVCSCALAVHFCFQVIIYII